MIFSSLLINFKHLRMSSEWIKLNIGGVVYQTTRMTLMKDQNSMIFSMFSENQLMEPGKMENGCYLIDRFNRQVLKIPHILNISF